MKTIISIINSFDIVSKLLKETLELMDLFLMEYSLDGGSIETIFQQSVESAASHKEKEHATNDGQENATNDGKENATNDGKKNATNDEKENASNDEKENATNDAKENATNDAKEHKSCDLEKKDGFVVGIYNNMVSQPTSHSDCLKKYNKRLYFQTALKIHPDKSKSSDHFGNLHNAYNQNRSLALMSIARLNGVDLELHNFPRECKKALQNELNEVSTHIKMLHSSVLFRWGGAHMHSKRQPARFDAFPNAIGFSIKLALKFGLCFTSQDVAQICHRHWGHCVRIFKECI
jgi:hypothetical protein